MPSSSEQAQMKNRNFICSCGKAYLSYAALFTHIKQKHDGKVSTMTTSGSRRDNPTPLIEQKRQAQEKLKALRR